jgi:4-coumarate--CoA ligase
MTEMSPVSHLVPFEAPQPGAVGPALPNTAFRIVDPETGGDRASGEEGELWVRGPQVMKGYHNNPAATAATLVADGWLRTGDLAVVDTDGRVCVRDRLKELIKVKGFQVAPAELEEVLLEHPGIADAAVIGVPDEETGERPEAFVVVAGGARLTEAEAMAHVAGRLASFKHLSRVTFVEAVPKSASGKILRRLLRDRAAERA